MWRDKSGMEREKKKKKKEKEETGNWGRTRSIYTRGRQTAQLPTRGVVKFAEQPHNPVAMKVVG